MSLASGIFVGFLSAVCVVAYAVPRRFRYIFLLLASYGFYLYSPNGFTENLPALMVLLSVTLVSFLCALGFEKTEKKHFRVFFLILSLLSSLGVLLYFKFAELFLEVLSLAPVDGLGLLLPLGMGYFVLQSVSYTLDIYRGKYKAERNVLRYALYVSFFPGIVTGPINRADQMLPQYKKPRPFSYAFVSGGLFRVLWGLVKKLVIADRLAQITIVVFSEPTAQSAPVLVLALLLFAYQLYLDFSGSCDIAIGAAQMLGFRFMENFQRPFAAKTYTEFWQRWHISLSSFFRDYVYIPLGGSRVPRWRWALNTLLVFVLSALWHGEGMGYLIWGLCTGSILVLIKLWTPYKERLVAKIPIYRIPAVRGVFQRIWVYLLFSFVLSFFIIALYNLPLQTFFLQLGVGWDSLPDFAVQVADIGLSFSAILLLSLCTLLVQVVEHFAVTAKSTVADWIRRRAWFCRWLLYYLLIILLLVFGLFGQSTFIYQQY